jgi:hypothetical protein
MTTAPPNNLGLGELAVNLLTRSIYLGRGPGQSPVVFSADTPTAAQLQQLSDDLQSLRDIAATDSDLASELADIQATIDALAASGATDSELAAAIGPIQAAIALLVSADSATATAIAAVQASVAGLDQTYATDAQVSALTSDLEDWLLALEGSIDALRIDLLTSPPAFGQGKAWTEVNSNGSRKYPWDWEAFNRGTAQAPIWEWRGRLELIASASLVAGATLAQTRIAYPWRQRSGSPCAYRLLSAQSCYFGPSAVTAASWSVSAILDRASTATVTNQSLLTFTNWSLPANAGRATTALEIAAGTIATIPLIEEIATGIAIGINPSAAGYSRSAQGSVIFTFVPVRL